MKRLEADLSLRVDASRADVRGYGRVELDGVLHRLRCGRHPQLDTPPMGGFHDDALAFCRVEVKVAGMDYLVFAQEKQARVPLARLLQNARNYFGLSVTVLDEQGVPADGTAALSSRVLLELENTQRGYRARFEVAARAALAADQVAARSAEEASRAGGMADLAQRCGVVWELTPAPLAPQPAVYDMCALLASTALGPVMPRDASALFGVRGALERARRASA